MALFVSIFAASPALAQSQPMPGPAGPSARAVEVTPFVSLGSPGSTPVSAAISFPLSDHLSVEAEVGYRRGEGRMHALSSNASVLWTLPRIGATVPYLAAGVGLAEYGAPILGRDGTPIGTEPLVAFTVNAGGGLKIPVDNAWGMRTDARWFKSHGRNASEHWRVAHGISFDVAKR
jgi:hypothetical protein